ncbi:hypothetical protein G6F22_019878 [Rhizopus arrhizus]|nr:hypothetical protein G6F22_019878 [Rhizopus arrhizus]
MLDEFGLDLGPGIDVDQRAAAQHQRHGGPRHADGTRDVGHRHRLAGALAGTAAVVVHRLPGLRWRLKPNGSGPCRAVALAWGPRTGQAAASRPAGPGPPPPRPPPPRHPLWFLEWSADVGSLALSVSDRFCPFLTVSDRF